MNRFWDIVIKPCLETIQAKSIVEIGSDKGIGTKNLIKYCKKVNGTLTSIDPFPKYDYEEWEREAEGVFKLYKDLSLNRLPLLNNYDAILVDGDHNWYSVYNELKIIQKTSRDNNLPLIFLHDVDWPYARRDLYYNPDNIPEAYRQAYAKKGIIPHELNLVENGGLNDHLCNSIYENNLHNGVLTAIEDFIEEYPAKEQIKYISLPGFFGLGIIFDVNRHEGIEQVIAEVYKNAKVTHKIEEERINFIIKNTELMKEKKALKHEKEELIKVNEEYNQKVQQRDEHIAELTYKMEIEKAEQQRLHQQNVQAKNANNMLQSTIQGIKTHYSEALNENSRLKQELEEQTKLANELQNKLKEKDKRIGKLTMDCQIHLGSVRYRLGDAIIKGIKPSVDTIKMPVRVIRLLKEGLKKRENRRRKVESVASKDSDVSVGSPKLGIASQTVAPVVKRTDLQVAQDKRYLLDLYDNAPSIEVHGDNPFVSIIVVNHNGAHHLDTFFESVIRNIEYKNFEIIIVDNASEDNSLEVINKYINTLNIKVIQNKVNETYSKANNQGVEIAKGEYLLFANNDIKVFKGWLEGLLNASLTINNIGAVGSLLFYPECPVDSLNKDKSFTIQHCGIKFRHLEDRIAPYNYLNGEAPHSSFCENTKIAGVTGASFMVAKSKFMQVGGFTESYIYGYEDVDLSLKLIKKGYENYLIPDSKAFHFEFGTQATQAAANITKRRLNNIKIFKATWQKWLEKQYTESIFTGNKEIFDKQIKVAFAVTEAGENVSAGDYFTAMEFGEAMKKRGWEIEFLKRKGPEDWYQVSDDVDMVIALLDAYDIRKVKCNNKNLITVAWARNWFERWANQPFIHDYTYVVASSELACEYMENIIGKKVHLLKIASNKERFTVQREVNKDLECDYCFTGSYWNDPREIIDMLNPAKHPQYKFNIYGANWDQIEKFRPYNQGFVSYATMPEIYASTKIVIDDANRVTKPFGSVNSRVFDALASGVLILTNGVLGAELTFNKMVPTFTSEEELDALLEEYLGNDEKRLELVKKLQDYVLQYHTYDNRVDELLEILGYEKPRKTIIIKTPVPRAEIANEWGDYHFALALKREFEKLNVECRYQFLNQWNEDDTDADAIMVLRGLSKYEPKNYHYNIMWNISHPDKVTTEEYYAYDQVYIASEKWSQEIKERKANDYTCIDTLLQCTDTNVFKPDESDEERYELLFVGNSRKIYRKVIKDLLPTKYNLSVFGTNWKGLIDDKYIKGENIPNTELYKHYGSAKIVLNDHWDDMREKGFISNRIFDVLASKGFLITDEVLGLEKYFEDSIVTYTDKADLAEKIEIYMNDESKRKEKIEKGYEIVNGKHTFEKRVIQMVQDWQHT